ncbi:MAG TPA: FkbM family methyltransferase [Kofleriaceae bacterium]|nr:FkbM family methyltransferase [Kofleriaceae bacterium]
MDVPTRFHARRLEAAHAIARFGVRLPLPLFWLTSNIVCRALLPALRGPLRCPTAYGFDLVVRATNGGNYYRCGFYEHGTMHVIASCLRAGDVFVDAGASVGQMSFHAARAVGASGRVLAFEPAPERYDDLAAGIAVNGFANVDASRAGLAAQPGELALYMRGSPSMADQTRTADVVRVPVRPLDDVLAEHAIDRVRFVKIDVEGLEPDVLLGARRLLASPEPPIVCYELGIYDHARAVHDILPASYALYQLAGTAHRPSPLVERAPHELRADNVFAIPRALVPTLPRTLFAPRALPAAA